MKKFFSAIIDRSYFLGFFLSSLLAWFAFSSSNLSVQSIKESFSKEEDVRSILQVSNHLQRSFALTSTALALGDIQLFKSGVADFDKSIEDFKKSSYLNKELSKKYEARMIEISKALQKMEAKFEGGAPPTVKELKSLVESLESLRVELALDEEESWGELIASQKGLVSSFKQNNKVSRTLQIIFSVFLALFMWVSIRKIKADKLIRASESLHRLMFSSLGEGVLLCLKNGEIATCNESAGKILGHKPKALIGQKLIQVFPTIMKEDGALYSDDESPLNVILSSGLSKENVVIGVYQPSGDLKWLSMGVQPLYDPDLDASLSTVISFSDITERVKAQETITQQQAQIVEASKMSTLGEMASGIAHEINNPLAIIQAEVDELQEEAEEGAQLPSEVAKRASGNITKTIHRISKIIKGLRTFSRDGRDDPFEPFGMNELLEDAMSLTEKRVKRRKVQIELMNLPKGLYIQCRAVQITQVLVNLLNNACDAIDHLDDKWIQIDFRDKGEEVEIVVTDSGRGISPAEHEKIFQPFFTTKELGKGTGLGLSISKGIIEAHNGTLTIDTNSKNTSFMICLPKKQKKNRDENLAA